jgi:hypothetical protein
MPTEQVHLAQASHNKDLIVYLNAANPGFPDWVITVAFYSAIHLLEAFLAKQLGYHSTSHVTRDSVLSKFSQLKPIYVDYSELKNTCWASRYNTLYSKWTAPQVQDALTSLQNIEHHLNSFP